MGHLQRYLAAVHSIHQTGAASPETSYYGPLAQLFDGIGADVKPTIKVVLTPRNQGAGHPDGAFFTEGQFKQLETPSLAKGHTPERGVLEVKGTSVPLEELARSEQVGRYLAHYGQVIITNIRDFAVVALDEAGKPALKEHLKVGRSESDFWARAAASVKEGKEREQEFTEFIKRALLRTAPVSTPEALAWLLAAYARESLRRIERVPAHKLDPVRRGLENGLGMEFKGKAGVHMFESTLVQTLFYGIFSAWVIWHQDRPPEGEKFRWKTATWTLNLPAIHGLFDELVKPQQIRDANLAEVLDWTEDALNRVRRNEFFSKFERKHAIQYFYEPFLAEFDPELKKALGVWYTPPEVVNYMVRRVDVALRTELGIEDGLADPRVRILDPCCGTGSFVLAALECISGTLAKRGKSSLHGEELKRAASKNIFGFEIMPAPFVVAHMQVALYLLQQGAHFDTASGERAGIYLTNSLTGWDAPEGRPDLSIFSELWDERAEAERVKRKEEILVILGNPPYNAFRGTAPVVDNHVIEDYRKGLRKKWGVKKNTLTDLYVRFFRLAELRIAERTGRGVICYITNFSYLHGEAFTVMRERLLSNFGKIWVDNLNGDRRETGKRTPEGKPDPSIFKTKYNSSGIGQGTCIGLFVKTDNDSSNARVWYRDFWGSDKTAQLASATVTDGPNYVGISDLDSPGLSPRPGNKYLLRPYQVDAQYLSWPKVKELAATEPLNGPTEYRGGSLMDHAHAPLAERVKLYLDPSSSDEQVAAVEPRFMKASGEFKPKKARKAILAKATFDGAWIKAYMFKPMDRRQAYLDPSIQPLFSRPNPGLLGIAGDAHRFLITRDARDRLPEGVPAIPSSTLHDRDALTGHARHFPYMIRADAQWTGIAQGTSAAQLTLAGHAVDSQAKVANISGRLRRLLEKSFGKVSELELAATCWNHVSAILHSPAYLRENDDGIARDWPRIPIPVNRNHWVRSCALGDELFSIMAEQPLSGIDIGRVRTELAILGNLKTVGGKELDVKHGDLELTAGWASWNQGKVMPGSGKVAERTFTDEEWQCLVEGASAQGLTEDQVERTIGKQCLDIFLNERVSIGPVPESVWQHVVGGYPVIKKWLSYREKVILGRGLSLDEVNELRGKVRRLTALLLMSARLDDNYRRCVDDSGEW